jgi:hypothetical protein
MICLKQEETILFSLIPSFECLERAGRYNNTDMPFFRLSVIKKQILKTGIHSVCSDVIELPPQLSENPEFL